MNRPTCDQWRKQTIHGDEIQRLFYYSKNSFFSLLFGMTMGWWSWMVTVYHSKTRLHVISKASVGIAGNKISHLPYDLSNVSALAT
jgi:hypothetical protein